MYVIFVYLIMVTFDGSATQNKNVFTERNGADASSGNLRSGSATIERAGALIIAPQTSANAKPKQSAAAKQSSHAASNRSLFKCFYFYQRQKS